MSKIDGLTLEKTEVSQTIDLEKITGKDLSNNPDLVQEIAQATIDYMIERVSEGKGVGGKKLKSPYSDDYADSLDFKAAGKSKSDVNMKLSGDMLGSIDAETDLSSFKISIKGDEAPKAYGHMTGFEGHPTIPEGKYKREFFGVTKEELERNVLSKFSQELESLDNESSTQTRLADAVRTIRVSDLFGEDE